MVWQDTVEIEVAWGRRGFVQPGTGIWDSSVWDGDAVWGAAEPRWIRLECDVASATVTRGRAAVTERFDTSTATVELVYDEPGQYGPTPDPAALHLGDELRLRARLRAGAATEWRPIWRGVIRSIANTQTPAGALRQRLECSDRLADLAAVNLPEQPEQGAGEQSDRRIARIVAAARLDPALTLLDPGAVPVQATTLARGLLDEAQVTAESEVGDLYCDRAGLVRFRARDWWRTDPRARDLRVVWSNFGHTEPDTVTVCPSGQFTAALSLDGVANQVSMARAGGTAITLTDSQSVQLYGLRTFQRFDLICVSDADVERAAAWNLAQRRIRTVASEPLQLNPEAQNPEADGWSVVLDLELGDRHVVAWETDPEAAPVTYPAWVQAITHQITVAQWVVSVVTSELWAWSPAAGWDVDNWDEAVWAAAATAADTELAEVA